MEHKICPSLNFCDKTQTLREALNLDDRQFQAISRPGCSSDLMGTGSMGWFRSRDQDGQMTAKDAEKETVEFLSPNWRVN